MTHIYFYLAHYWDDDNQRYLIPWLVADLQRAQGVGRVLHVLDADGIDRIDEYRHLMTAKGDA